MNQRKSNEMHLGISIGLVCFTEKVSTIFCSLCASQREFSKLLNFISHITQEHDCTSGIENDADKESGSGKIRSQVIDTNFLEKSKECGSSCKTGYSTDYLHRTDDPMEAKPNSKCRKETQQELRNEINIVKNEKDNFNMVEISSKEFYCHYCKTNFLSGKEIVQHTCKSISRSYAKKIYCDSCDTNFSLKSELLNHNCSIDESFSVDLIKGEDGTSGIENNNKYCCTICSVKLKTSSNLKRHMMTHNANKPFKCKYCPKTCINPSRLKKHLQTHEQSSRNTLSCPHCPVLLKSYHTLRYHLLSHTDHKSFKCEHCNRCYYTPSKLREHVKNSHNGKEFPCEFCSAVLKSKKSLNFHMLKHNGDKSFKCEHCSSEFYRSDKLKRHMLTHSGKKTFKCEQCSRAFYRKDRLQSHILTHSGKKPYGCEHCRSTFSTTDKLKLHMKKHAE